MSSSWDVLADHRQWGRLEELLSFVKVRSFSTNLVVWGGAADFYALFVTLKPAVVENTFLETGERTFFFVLSYAIVQGNSCHWEWLLVLRQPSRYLFTFHLRTETDLFLKRCVPYLMRQAMRKIQKPNNPQRLLKLYRHLIVGRWCKLREMDK